MKKLLIFIGSLSIVASLYLLFKGESFQSVIGPLLCGFVLFGFVFEKEAKSHCKTK